MKKIVLIPDSFKGTMSSAEICEIMKQAISKYSDAEVISVPVADGGEGSVDAFLAALGGEKINVTVKNPYMEDMDAFYGIIDNGHTAVIEMAACAGLPLVSDRLNPLKTTTYGVGQLVADALSKGCRKIIMGLGGSCTNDGGCGCAAALGVKFKDKDGNYFIPVGETLKDIVSIDKSDILPILSKTQITVMCDIDNPLYGKNGAAFVFGPQKGADRNQVIALDNGLINLAEIISKDLDIDIDTLAGAGAAGGMGAGMVAFLDGKLQMGIDTVLDTVRFNELIKDADLVISGEGKIDTQSIRGKVVIGVASRTKKADCPLVAVVGDIGDDIEEAYEKGVSAIFSINRVAVDFSKAKLRAKDDLRLTVENIFRFTNSINS